MNTTAFLSIRCTLAMAILLGAVTMLASKAQAQSNYTWDPNANRSDAAGSGTWSTLATNTVWDNGSADVIWTNGNNAMFGGADGAYTVTVANGISVGIPTFNASGYTLQGASAASPGTLALNYAGNIYGELYVANGKTLTIGANMTVSSPTTGTTEINNTAATVTGTINVLNGGVLTFGGNGSVGGTFNVGAGSTLGSIFYEGSIANSTINVNGAGAAFHSRGATVTNSTFNINQGTFDLGGGSGTGLTNSTINLQPGGTFIAGFISNTDAASTINLNGGLFQNTDYGGFAPAGAYSSNAVKLVVQTGGAKFDSSYRVTVPVALLHDPANMGLDGGLTKTSSGTLTLTVAGTYNGGTTVVGGTLAVAVNGALGTGNVNVLNTAVSLSIGTGVTTPINSATAILTLGGGGTANKADLGYLDLTSGANITVGGLVLGMTTEPNGVYTAAMYPEFISGSGTVTVVPEPTTWRLLLTTGVCVVGGCFARRGRVV